VRLSTLYTFIKPTNFPELVLQYLTMETLHPRTPNVNKGLKALSPDLSLTFRSHTLRSLTFGVLKLRELTISSLYNVKVYINRYDGARKFEWWLASGFKLRPCALILCPFKSPCA
jgi:hypothetical protein